MTRPTRYGIVDIMKKIEQTIMTIEDITEHNDCLPPIHRREQDRTDTEYYDDMLIRFTRTFMTLESEVT